MVSPTAVARLVLAEGDARREILSAAQPPAGREQDEAGRAPCRLTGPLTREPQSVPAPVEVMEPEIEAPLR